MNFNQFNLSVSLAFSQIFIFDNSQHESMPRKQMVKKSNPKHGFGLLSKASGIIYIYSFHLGTNSRCSFSKQIPMIVAIPSFGFTVNRRGNGKIEHLILYTFIPKEKNERRNCSGLSDKSDRFSNSVISTFKRQLV